MESYSRWHQNNLTCLLYTVDRKLPTQQNLAAFSVAVIVLRGRTNRLADLKPLVPALLAAIESARSGAAKLVG
jgi:hypothetical protein